MSQFRIRNRAVVAHAASFLLVLGLVGAASSTELECGDNVTSKVKLETDLSCTGSGLIVAADNVTIDLNGHTITGIAPGPDPRWSGIKTLRGTSLKNVRVRNGTIVGFDRGISMRGVDRGVVRHVVIRGTMIDGIEVSDSSKIVIQNSVVKDPQGSGMIFRLSTDVSIKTVSVTSQQPNGVGIILNGVVDAEVSNAHVDGVLQSLWIGCEADGGCASPGEIRGNGKIRDNVFSNSWNGITMQNVVDYVVSGNHIWGMTDPNGFGYGIGGGFYSTSDGPPLRNLRIADNTVISSDQGITFAQLIDSTYERNKTLHNSGVGLAYSSDCTGNKSEENIALGNGVDLYSEVSSYDNAWENNICQTTYGDGPECDPLVPW